MGPTGSGRSTVRSYFADRLPFFSKAIQFINVATGQAGGTVGHHLKSCTSDIRAVRVNHPATGIPVTFIDTPGFDDSVKTDMEILTLIADWLVKT
jgi:hypothetical protein